MGAFGSKRRVEVGRNGNDRNGKADDI